MAQLTTCLNIYRSGIYNFSGIFKTQSLQCQLSMDSSKSIIELDAGFGSRSVGGGTGFLSRLHVLNSTVERQKDKLEIDTTI